jgi:hypothetical protein
MKKHHIMLVALLSVAGGLKPVLAADASSATDASAKPADQTAESAAAQPAEAAAPAPSGSVARASFTTAVQEREPVDNINAISNDNTRIYYFSEIRGMAGHTVTHRWEHDGKVMAEVPFNIGGDRWRAYSSKNLDPSWTGEWKVSVVTEGGETLSVNTFNYESAPAAGETAPPAAADAPEAPAAGGEPK